MIATRAEQAFYLLKEAVRIFYDLDCQELLSYNYGELKGLERSIAFLVGHYFAEFVQSTKTLAEYSVDMEYNRYGNEGEIKRIKHSIDGYEERSKIIRPDLLLHRRGSRKIDNILVCEFKVENTKIDNDYEKIRFMTLNNPNIRDGYELQEYNYEIGVSVFMEKTLATFCIFDNGEKKETPVTISVKEMQHV